MDEEMKQAAEALRLAQEAGFEMDERPYYWTGTLGDIVSLIRLARLDARHDAAWLADFVIQKHGGTNDLPAWVAESARYWKELSEARDALQRFKDFVHLRLDSAGVPSHPNGPHSAHGCRIGDRLDILIERLK